VPHGHAVAHARNTEKERVAAAGVNPFLNKTLQIAHADMPGNQVGETGCHADKRLVHLIVRYTGTFQQGAMRSPLKPFLYHITAHGNVLGVELV